MPKMKYTSKRERFIKVAEQRTNAVLDKLRVLGHCSNRSLYEYTEEEINKIFYAIQEKIKEIKSKFKINKDKKFKL